MRVILIAFPITAVVMRAVDVRHISDVRAGWFIQQTLINAVIANLRSLKPVSSIQTCTGTFHDCFSL